MSGGFESASGQMFCFGIHPKQTHESEPFSGMAEVIARLAFKFERIIGILTTSEAFFPSGHV